MISKRTAAHAAAAALVVVALGLVAALASSSDSTAVGSKPFRADFRRLTAGGSTKGSAAAAQSTGPEIRHGVRVAPAELDGSVRKLPQIAPKRLVRPGREERELVPPTGQKQPLPGAQEPSRVAPSVRSAPAPDPIVTFKGLFFPTWGAGHPPDTVGDVGPDRFVQAVNTSIGIFAKTGGAPLAAFTFDAFFTGTGTACDTDNQGDPTVVYDPQSDHWIVADFAFTGDPSTPPFYECIAVSKTGDPVSGGWWFYAIRTDDASHPWFADYPKMGIWPDGLYMTANMFDATGTFQEVRAWAFNRSDLEAGLPVRNVVVDVADIEAVDPHFSLLPSNMRAVTGKPPAGRPNLLVSESVVDFAFEVWKFHVDYSGSGSIFTGPTNVSQASYNFNAPFVVPTPANSLDALFDRLMMQAQYVNLGGTESVWVNHTVHCCGAGTPMGIQWAQLNVTGGNAATTPVQQQIYPPANDTLHRWMGSLAVDWKGDMALGYSLANGTTNPDIFYAGRLAGDTLGTLPQSETSMLQGVTRGSQSGDCPFPSPCERWGDYSAMSVDPDGCTFWYTQEYYETDGLDWQTRIGSFTFPSCTPKTLQSISFGPLPDKTFGDADFTVSASADSGLSVSFAASGNCTVSGSTVHIIGAGSCTITASQPGNDTYGPAPDVARTFAIAKANQSISFGALPDRTAVDADFGVAATASSGLPVSFAASGSCTVSGSTVHLTGVGTCTVTASQPGDANFNAAPDVAQSFAIVRASQAITFAAVPAKTFGDPDFALSATASSGLAVSFAAGGTCTVSGVTVHLMGAGSCVVTASQPGNAGYNAAAAVVQTIPVAKAAQTITFGVLADKKLGAKNFPVTASASSRLPVAFSARGKCTVSGKTVHLTGGGKCTITASQAGDANFNAAPSVARSFKIVACTVPKVVGKTLSAAKRALKRGHCRAGRVTFAYSKKTKKDRVSSQSRRPRRVLPANAKINLVVSRGRKP